MRLPIWLTVSLSQAVQCHRPAVCRIHRAAAAFHPAPLPALVPVTKLHAVVAAAGDRPLDRHADGGPVVLVHEVEEPGFVARESAFRQPDEFLQFAAPPDLAAREIA
jgi:hypothetical protein